MTGWDGGPCCRGVAMQECVHQRARAVAGGRMHDHARRLVDHRDVVVFVDDVERDQGVLHPHAVGGDLVEHEHHAGVLRHGLAVHQALHAGAHGVGHFGADGVHAGRQLDRRQLGAGVALDFRPDRAALPARATVVEIQACS